jgi:hypothetical protein
MFVVYSAQVVAKFCKCGFGTSANVDPEIYAWKVDILPEVACWQADRDLMARLASLMMPVVHSLVCVSAEKAREI